MRPWPGWLVFLLFVPLQVYFAILLFREWGFWASLGFLLVLGFVGNRAARAPWLTSLLFPGHAWRHERRRHVFQGVLFLGAGALLVLHYAGVATYGPLVHWFGVERGIPLLAAMLGATLLKASVR